MAGALALALVLPAVSASEGEKKEIKKVEFDVEGMHCGGCAGRGEKALKAAPGVKTAKVTFETKSAVVEYVEGETTVLALIKVLKDAGLTAKVKEPKKSE